MYCIILITITLLSPLTALSAESSINAAAEKKPATHTPGTSQLPSVTMPAKKTTSISGITEIKWDDLVPANYDPDKILKKYSKKLQQLQDDDPEALAILGEVRAAWDKAPVVSALDGKVVKIAGHVVPLEGDDKNVKEFLLVPYFGACIHVPPPPSNQVVYVIAPEKGISIDQVFEIVWVIGTLHTETRASNLAQTGYTLQATRVDPY